MDYGDFIDSMNDFSPPSEISSELNALWLDKKRQWDAAHDLIQNLSGRGPARVHAYLHRKEGDIWNAKYWYSMAKDKMPDISLDEEWQLLVSKYTY